jgi:hypothetical protein
MNYILIVLSDYMFTLNKCIYISYIVLYASCGVLFNIIS